ncbi:Osmotically-inducible protein OsmY, contains BON domain [Tistlia consotensis]|uniref:Osmotically-inducible protein OsmY, contains BON domain n=1 Tax=Tistlia consotensis USBA 355 TaxID=560819 RepID=A0A1Y6BKW1_9PROT|nr:BON domain-containing protein [Tistlia consotensis]SMF08718.1 Osmotically-inducible protein OsmY, contains BON domain [Tistlia consotensis USBA 355]SNR35225.1 Osmotically-inducible protein OsmY, contains BON domain [Tistlia consotensis]
MPVSRLPLAGLALLCCLLPGACSPTGAAVGAAATGGLAASSEKGFAAAVDDAAIRAGLNDRFFKKNLELFADVNFAVEEGRVLLTGDVPTPADEVEAVRLAWQPEGVKEVIDELRVRDDSSLIDAARDRWIATELKADLVFDREVSAVNYSIEVVNGVVYLLGVARTQQELDTIERYVKQIAYVQGFVSYVHVLEPAK